MLDVQLYIKMEMEKMLWRELLPYSPYIDQLNNTLSIYRKECKESTTVKLETLYLYRDRQKE